MAFVTYPGEGQQKIFARGHAVTVTFDVLENFQSSETMTQARIMAPQKNLARYLLFLERSPRQISWSLLPRGHSMTYITWYNLPPHYNHKRNCCSGFATRILLIFQGIQNLIKTVPNLSISAQLLWNLNLCNINNHNITCRTLNWKGLNSTRSSLVVSSIYFTSLIYFILKLGGTV